MIKRTDVQTSLVSYTVYKNVRNDMIKDIRKYYVGKTDSNIGFAYGMMKEGRIHCQGMHRRTDIFWIRFLSDIPDLALSVFIEADSEYSINQWNDIVIEDEDRVFIVDSIKELFKKEAKWIAEQAKWIAHDKEIIKSIHGKTPEEAIAILTNWEETLYGNE